MYFENMSFDLTNVPEEHLKKFATLLDRAKEINESELARDDFMAFTKAVWEDFINGRHHKIMAEKFNRLARGELKRLIVNMPPRHTKSEFGSYLLPAWLMGRRPTLKIMQTTHTAELAFRFGRKTRNLMNSEAYKKIFDVELRADSQAAGRWETSKGGEYFAAGVGGAVTGRGADLLIIDDPVSEQDALNPTMLDNIYEWYTSGPRQRLQPGGSIIIVMTRWSVRDLTAKVLKKQAEGGADNWEVVEFPAIFPDTDNVLWPEYWKREELEAVRSSIPVAKWNAQYLQNPTAEEGAIIKREWWNLWEHDDPPPVSYIIQSYDTAYSKSERADYSAITTWGIFSPEEGDSEGIILLDAERGRWDFPELKNNAYRLYKEFDPDMILIEQKATGTPLTHELRTMGIPVTPFTPSRGADKFTRMNACAPVFESGMVWRPDKRFADEVVEECAAFPNGEHDDLADSMTQAILRFRQGGFIMTPSDYEDEDYYREKREYY